MMTEYLVWILVSVSAGAGNYGNANILAQFKELDQCKATVATIKSMSRAVSRNVEMQCIQAKIYK